jgi:16S rRNA (adenine1518-N6/adenine1519-N6)-dimethyltransferase
VTSSPDFPDLAGLPPLKDVIRRFGLAAKKSLGQHFLLDLNLCAKIAGAAGGMSGRTVIEIGPGPGGLTRALLEGGAARVVAVERDRRCVEALGELARAYPGRLEIIEGDALEVDCAALGPAPRKIVANLPYNIATPLLIGWLKQAQKFESLTLTFQKEVAGRLIAEPGSRAYGRLTVISRWLCEVGMNFNIDRRAFTPPPKVASSVVTLTPRPGPLAKADWSVLEKVTAAAFGQRRKMLRGSLKALNVDGEKLCRDAGIEPTLRAENLTVEQFCALARNLI